MPSRDWTSLDWAPTLNFALPTERQLAQSSQPDAGKGAEYKFNPTSMNAQLLASLGYGGQGLASSTPDEWGNSGPQWSDDARTWLANQGYTVGVAHDPGTTSGGRAEYYGLVDPSGNFVGGQDDPTMTISDTMMDNITPFLMMAGPFASAISTASGLASGLGAAAGAGEAGAAAGGAGATGSGLVQGSSNFWDLVQKGALRGAGTGAIKGIATGQNPFTSALKGAVGGAVGGGIGSIGQGSLGNLMGGLDAGPGSLDIIPDAFGDVSGAATDGVLDNFGSFSDAAGGVGGGFGGSMGFSGLDNLFSNWTPDQLNLTQDITGNVLPVDMPTFSGDAGYWNPGIVDFLQGNGGSLPQADYSNEGRNYSGPGGINPLYNSPAYTDNIEEPTWLDTFKSWFTPVANGSGGTKANPIGAGIGGLAGALLGAASSKSGTLTQTREPWIAAQPFLKDVLGDLGTMRANLDANPFTPQQTAAYGNAFAGLDQARAALPGLLGWSQSAMQRQSIAPSYDQLFGGGLLSNRPAPQPTPGPTAQAGGIGGLLGNDDRMQALAMRRQALTG